MKKVLSALLCLNVSLFAFSTSSISVLNGDFDGNSAIYDTSDGGGKTTITLEHLTKGEAGDIFFFIDYVIADDTMLYSTNKTAMYGEFMPRLSLSYLTGEDLSYSIVSDVFIAGQLNAGSGADFRAELIGLGLNLTIPGFDFVQLNTYYKHVNLTIPDSTNGFALTDFSRDTYQISPVYGTHFGDTGITFKGWMDLTGYSFSTQNQLLYEIGESKVQVGVEYLYYYEKKSDNGVNTHPKTSVLQIMAKYNW